MLGLEGKCPVPPSFALGSALWGLTLLPGPREGGPEAGWGRQAGCERQRRCRPLEGAGTLPRGRGRPASKELIVGEVWGCPRSCWDCGLHSPHPSKNVVLSPWAPRSPALALSRHVRPRERGTLPGAWRLWAAGRAGPSACSPVCCPRACGRLRPPAWTVSFLGNRTCLRRICRCPSALQGLAGSRTDGSASCPPHVCARGVSALREPRIGRWGPRKQRVGSARPAERAQQRGTPWGSGRSRAGRAVSCSWPRAGGFGQGQGPACSRALGPGATRACHCRKPAHAAGSAPGLHCPLLQAAPGSITNGEGCPYSALTFGRLAKLSGGAGVARAVSPPGSPEAPTAAGTGRPVCKVSVGVILAAGISDRRPPERGAPCRSGELLPFLLPADSGAILAAGDPACLLVPWLK